MRIRTTPVQKEVGIKGEQFKTVTITKAIYATGWDGDIVLEADEQDGSWKVIEPENEDPTTTLININTAGLNELKELPGIGPTTLNKIKSLVTVGD